MSALLFFLFSFLLKLNISISNSTEFERELRIVNGIYIYATNKSWNTLPSALDIAACTIKHMTELLPKYILSKMKGHKVYVYHGDPSISTGVGLGPKKPEFDYPSDIYSLTSPTFDGRAVDQVYGYGGTLNGPTTILDCHLVCVYPNNLYWSENILVHEFAHTIMEIGILLANSTLYYQLLNGTIYNEFLNNVNTANQYYCGWNGQEMFACSTQAWLVATMRTDVNFGIETYDRVSSSIPTLAALFKNIYGEAVYPYILNLTNVYEMEYKPDWVYYNKYINEYGDWTIKNHWNVIKKISKAPTVVTVAPTTMPSIIPTVIPSIIPSVMPSFDPTIEPTLMPSVKPSLTSNVRNAKMYGLLHIALLLLLFACFC